MSTDFAHLPALTRDEQGQVRELIRAMGRGVAVAELGSETLLTEEELWTTIIAARDLDWLAWVNGQLQLTPLGKSEIGLAPDALGLPDWRSCPDPTPMLAPIAFCSDDCMVEPFMPDDTMRASEPDLSEFLAEEVAPLELDSDAVVDPTEPLTGSLHTLQPDEGVLEGAAGLELLESVDADALGNALELNAELALDLDETTVDNAEVAETLSEELENNPVHIMSVGVLAELPVETATVRFLVHNDQTQPGDTLVLLGDEDQLGGWDEDGALELNADNWPLWRLDRTLPVGLEFACKAAIRRADGTLEWLGTDNVLVEVKSAAVEVPVDVECSATQPGDVVVIVGSCPSVGCWEASAGIEMSPTEWPRWQGMITLPAGETVQLKPLIRHPEGNVSWLDGPIHTVSTPTAQPLVVLL